MDHENDGFIWLHKTGFLPSCGCVSRTIRMHHVEANGRPGEKVCEYLQECYRLFWTNSRNNSRKKSNCMPTHLLSETIQLRRTRPVGHCRRSKDELSSNNFWLTPTHGHVSLCRSERTYISSVGTLDSVYRTNQVRGTKGKSWGGERESQLDQKMMIC